MWNKSFTIKFGTEKFISGRLVTYMISAEAPGNMAPKKQ